MLVEYHARMLSVEDNELLTRVGKGRPMGELLRRFWQPVLLSSELPKPDCPPVRVRALGERLVAFRNTSGEVGLIAEACPHRRASLFFGRNEEDGLRCIYHGWKYDRDGNCVDMPSEPAGSNFASKVHTTAYPCRETNGVIFAYLGPPELQPALPGIEWIGLPEGHVYVTKRYEFANWVQGLEGGIDSSHANFLHTTVDAFHQTSRFFDGLSSRLQFDSKLVEYFIRDLSPRFYLRDTDYGVMIGTQRDAEEDSFYWRITHWLLPHSNIFGGVRDDGATRLGRGLIWSAIDDYTTAVYSVSWAIDSPLTESERAACEAFSGAVVPGTSMPVQTMQNDYLIDRERQATETFTGIESLQAQDLAAQEGMGAIVDRTEEHLGTSDSAIIRVRRALIRAARDLMEGAEPPQATRPSSYRLRTIDLIRPRADGFDSEEIEELCRVR